MEHDRSCVFTRYQRSTRGCTCCTCSTARTCLMSEEGTITFSRSMIFTVHFFKLIIQSISCCPFEIDS